MRYENRTESRVSADPAKVIPDKAGFYWAKWRIPEDGTDDEEHFVAVDWWEVVEVHDSLGGDEPLRASIAGVRQTQSLENFVWHKPIAPLEVPTP
ncbi:hypothetical protein EOA79_02510 [Mesorhizobium sp. M1A.F.Ca.IN.020.03.2.1]|uniref:hypothetical protein n=1 Tax=Mesorhizobium sp. M1A.F.Ca.IN.020.03.2.1 TaxID=2496769 RepID=UPI000FD28C97|nr:hypothetical protein [Mesorhizobium sp. M1A.F.Ca.IN.020.03.2.1]RUV07980.1 hypothetical protein EOA79_02510 [Mesorhizobium sp. M1A.F.Ca.IN.020.03.2.1]